MCECERQRKEGGGGGGGAGVTRKASAPAPLSKYSVTTWLPTGRGGRGSAVGVALMYIAPQARPGREQGENRGLDAPIAGHTPSNDHQTPAIASQDTHGCPGRAPGVVLGLGMCLGSWEMGRA